MEQKVTIRDFNEIHYFYEWRIDMNKHIFFLHCSNTIADAERFDFDYSFTSILVVFSCVKNSC